MIHVRIDNRHSTAVDIYVNISPKQNSIISSSPMPLNDEPIYDRLFDTKNYPLRQSKIVKNRTDYVNPLNKKNYTLQQILDNVETIQQQYEQVINNRKTSSSSSSCFFTFKQITKLLKNLRTIKTKTNNESIENNYSENKSPFIFGGETLQWIALPQDDNHIYENEFIQ
jgi:hypothetical protein